MRSHLKFLGTILFALVFLAGGGISNVANATGALTYSHVPSGNLTVGVQANFVVLAPDNTGHIVSLSDGNAGGVFYGGAIGGYTCNQDTSLTTITIASGDTQKAFCYSNATAGTYTITSSTGSLDPVSTSVTVTAGVITIGGTTYGTIQAAITAAISGDTINIGAGTYVEKLLIEGKTNLTLQGVGDGSLIEPASDDSGTAGIIIKNSNGLTINDLKIHTRGIEMEGIWVYGFGRGGNAVTGLTIHDTTINVDGGSAGQAAAGIIGDSASDAVHSGWHITDNTINITGTGSTPMVLQDVSASEFSRNIVTNSSVGSSTIWSSERWNLADIIFSDNQFSGGAKRQIYFLTDYNQIDGGTNIPVETPSIIPTSITEVTFHGNTFSSWGQGAIRVGTLAATTTGTITAFDITNNTFNVSTDTPPIELLGTPTLTGSGNIFNVSGTAKIQKAVDAALGTETLGDTINIATGTYDEQVVISGKNNLTLIGAGDTTIIEPAYVINTAAIKIKHSDGLTIKDLKIHTSGNEQQGIWIKGALYDDDLAVIGLTIQNTTIDVGASSGICVDASTDAAHSGWLITGNRITSGAVAMSIQDLTNSTITGNTLTAGTSTNVLWTGERFNLNNLVFTNNIINGSGGSQVTFLTDYNTTGESNVPPEGDPAFDSSIQGITISGNTFDTWGSRGLRIGSGVSGVDVSQNKFLKTGEALKNENSSTINAESNYWGEANPNFSTKIVTLGGVVDHDPWWMNSAMSLPSTLISTFTTIHDNLVTAGILNNIDTCATAPNACTGLYFEKTGFGKISFAGTLDLTDGSTTTFLTGLGAKLDMNNGRIALDATTSSLFSSTGATLEMYNIMTSVDVSKIVVRDESNNILTGVVSSFAYDANNHKISFSAAHFTQFDIDTTLPVITRSGPSSIDVPYGSTYTDAGATATDNIDGNITSSIVRTGLELVDTSTIGGTYIIHYNVSDTAHNAATEITRTVNVVKASQATLTVNAISGGVIYGTTATLETTGGSGTGALTYSTGSSTGCSVTEAVLSITNASGTCSITATKAADTNYNATTSASLAIALHKADSNVTLLPTATPITYGQTLANSTLSGGTSTPAGTFAFTTLATAPNAGAASQGVTFTPGDTNNYNEATGSISVTVNKAAQTITWANPADITYGIALNGMLLNATSTGTANGATPVYTPASGSVLNFGNTQELSVTFSSTNNYNSTTQTAHINVLKRPITITAVTNTKTTDSNTSSSEKPTSLTTGTLASGDTATYSETYDTSTVGAGKTLTPSVVIKNASDVDVTVNYNITAVTDSTGVILSTAQITPETDSHGNGLATINATTPEVVIASANQPVIITVETTGTTLDLTELVNLNTGTGILPQMTITAGNASVEIPDDTTVTALGWNGIMSAPTAGSTSGTAPAGFSVGNTVIEMGSPDFTLTFNKAVKITLPGVTGTVGYRPSGSNVWTQITNVCAGTYESPTAPVAGSECAINNGMDTRIVTFHFTSFGELNVAHGSSGSYIKPATPANVTTPDGCAAGNKFSTTTGRNCNAATPAIGKVLGAEKFNFTKFMKNGSKGTEIIELQNFLTTLGYTLVADGKFGPKTKGAVVKFQIANSLKGDGIVGALTRAVLNK